MCNTESIFLNNIYKPLKCDIIFETLNLNDISEA